MKIRAMMAAAAGLAAVVSLGATSAAWARPDSYVVVVDSGDDVLSLFDPFDGSFVQAEWIRYADWGLDSSAGTPREAIRVGNQLWVSDQTQDAIHRFRIDRVAPAYLGSITAGLDNIRGMEFHDGVVYVCNAGTGNGAPGASIVKFNRRGQNLGFFTVGDPFDVVYQDSTGELLISNIADEDIDRYSLSGAFLGKYHNSDGVSGIDFPVQIAIDPSGVNDIYVAGFSAPVAVYSYKGGAPTAAFTGIPGPRGVAALGNGRLLVTDGMNVRVLDPASEQAPIVFSSSTGSFQYANVVAFYCPADVNADGFVNGNDYDEFASFFDAADAEADFDGDGFVNGNDYDAFASAFDGGC